MAAALGLLLCGCSPDTDSSGGAGTLSESEQLARGYIEIYAEARKAGTLGSLDTIEDIVDALGEAGYPAVDTENQVNMVRPEVIRGFYDSVEEGEAAETSLFLVTDDGGFVRYDLTSEDGTVHVERSRLGWEDGKPGAEKVDSYEAHTWKMDEESGYLYVEKAQPAGYDGSIGYTAVRVEPLDGELRELNRKYILPVGYRHTNLFLTDWEESDYGEIDFYDLFEEFYEEEYDKSIPYASDFEKRTYEVPARVFEAAVTRHFQIDTDTLRAHADYDSDTSAYLYVTRCREDWGHPCFVTPEVRGYEELEDGALKLKVCSVSQQDNPAHTFSHEVVVRTFPGGEYQYVSNRVLPADHELDMDWYAERMTEQEWEEQYGGE